MTAARVGVGLVFALMGCSGPRATPCEAYVWNRAWTAAVRDAVATRPSELAGLRVLVVEAGPHPVEVAVDEQILKGVVVVPVLRANDELPDDATWARFLKRVGQLRDAGVLVSQVEVDFDSPVERLEAYGAWLASTRQSLGSLKRSVTALPTWNGASSLAELTAQVDEVVLQVHAIRSPVLFDVDAAERDITQWTAATHRPFKVALPSYRMRLASGEELIASPTDVARVLRFIDATPTVSGVVFFRLGHDEDPGAWSLQALRTVLRRAPFEPRVTVELSRVQAELEDVWLHNPGVVDVEAPPRLHFVGTITDAFPTTGYVRVGESDFATHDRQWIRPGQHVRVGSVRGKELHVSVQ